MNREIRLLLLSASVLLFLVGNTLVPCQADGPDFSSVKTYLTASVHDGTVAGGVVMVWQDGEVVFETGFGYADLKTKKPFEIETPVVIASISKPILGTAAFRLAESGTLDVLAPISEYLPEFSGLKLESGEALLRAPTMVELFTHTSGIRGHYEPGGRPWFADWTKGQPLSFVVAKYASDFPFRSQPGTRFAYSGIGTDVAARVMEVVTNSPRNELLLQLVCQPLEMNDTFYRGTTGFDQTRMMPTRYYRGANKKLYASRKRAPPSPNTYSSSGGSIVSTARDLSRWLLMIRNGGQHDNQHGGKPFLSQQTLKQMLTRCNIGNFSQGGFTIRKSDPSGIPLVIGHTGSSGTNVWIDFESDTIGIMLTQTRGSDIKPFRVELEKRITNCMLVLQ